MRRDPIMKIGIAPGRSLTTWPKKSETEKPKMPVVSGRTTHTSVNTTFVIRGTGMQPWHAWRSVWTEFTASGDSPCTFCRRLTLLLPKLNAKRCDQDN